MDTQTRNIVFLSGASIVSVSTGAMLGNMGSGWVIFGCCMLVASCFSWWRHG